MQKILRPFAVLAVEWREVVNKVTASLADRKPRELTGIRAKVQIAIDAVTVPLAKFAVYYETIKSQVRFDARLGVLDKLAKEIQESLMKQMDAYQSTEDEVKKLEGENDHTRAHRDRIKELKAQLDSNYKVGQEYTARLERIQEAVEKTKAEAYNETIKRKSIW